MAEHAPLPWELSPTDDTMIVDATGREVCAIDGDYNSPDDWPIMEANAANIVHCVNTHDQSQARIKELEAALWAQEHLYVSGILPPPVEEIARVHALRRAALASQKTPDLVGNKVCRPLSEDKPAPVNGESEGDEIIVETDELRERFRKIERLLFQIWPLKLKHLREVKEIIETVLSKREGM